ncbi:MAG: hypothetical protein LBI01_06610 [Elusimicrobium sp.]|jgi:hypothetical protein|nr:hypothetical protein [Elusimicrobium sp.]
MMNKKGLTIAEAVISMVLLAIITMGIYGVIMASVRSGKKPDMREDMAYAIETASAKLQGLIQNDKICKEWNPDPNLDNCVTHPDKCCLNLTTSDDIKYNDLCEKNFANVYNPDTGSRMNVSTPFQEKAEYHIECLLPKSCVGDSKFYYTSTNIGTADVPLYNIKFFIQCNGQTQTT